MTSYGEIPHNTFTFKTISVTRASIVVYTTDDVLHTGKWNKTPMADEWRLTKLNDTADTWAFVLGPQNEFIACWDKSDRFADPRLKNAHPLRKKPFPAGKLPGKGCGWEKVWPRLSKCILDKYRKPARRPRHPVARPLNA